MVVVARPQRRAAGVRFEVVPPPLAQVLPRMDVAVFVGFAASGPLHIPVAVEDASHFESIFGSDAPLAWDAGLGRIQNAYLAPAVRAYFQNGGQRCWVIRVAAVATTNEFPVAGMLQRSLDGTLQAAAVFARSQGSWSDSLGVACALMSRPLAPSALAVADFPASLLVVTRAQDDVVVGDLLRVTFYDSPTQGVFESRVAFFVVASLVTVNVARPFGTTVQLVPVSRADGTPSVAWFRTALASVPVNAEGTVTLGATSAPASLVAAVGGNYEILVSLPFSAAPPFGTTLAVNFGAEQLWLTVTGAVNVDVSPVDQRMLLSGTGFFVDPEPAEAPSSAFEIERLQLALSTRSAAAAPLTIANLGFDPSHPRPFWGLPSDEELYRGTDDAIDTDPRWKQLRGLADSLAPLWSDVAEPRFDLAAAGTSDVTFLPVGMPYTPDFWLPPVAVAGTGLERDGLAKFDASLFLDPGLMSVGVNALMGVANFLMYQSSEPRRLQGIHAALGLDEATLIVVPDAALPGWQKSPISAPAASLPAQPIVPGQNGSFFDCALRELQLPVLRVGTEPDAAGTFELDWDPVENAQTYELQESSDPTFGLGVVTYDTVDTHLVVYGHAPGCVYLRARALAGSVDSGWSGSIGVSIAQGSGWAIPAGSNPAQPNGIEWQVLSAVHDALLKMCAARGDLFALMSLPNVQQASDAAAYVSALCGSQTTKTLGYGAVYHPWVVVRDAATGPLRTLPPDGVIAGIFARRTLARGAWVAPANEPLAASVLGLSPRAPDAVWAVLDAQPVNRIREEARGLMNMSADTLTSDPDFAPINVRRLLMLLRRAALCLGNTYVFEPNDDRLARAVEASFTSLLDSLYRRGALTGATASDAYRVITDGTVNPPASVDGGRFVVELQVAPSQPLAFLTVRLVQTGGQFTVSEGS